MLQIPNDEKKRIVTKRILRELALYYSQHKGGMSMSSLSAKYNRACGQFGELTTLMDELQRDNLIHIAYAESGGRTVHLRENVPDAVRAVAKAKEWF